MKFLISLFMLLPFLECQAQSFSAMTYNIRLDTESDGENQWNNRKEFLLGQLEFYSPDVFGVQEALPNQMQFLRDSLTNFDMVGKGREGGNKGEFSALFYKKDVFELLDNDTFWLSESPDSVSIGWDAALPRICTWAKLRVRGSESEIFVFNTHFDHIGKLARKNSIDLILKKIKELNPEGLPSLFLGDLNLEPNSVEIIDLSEKMIDCRTLAAEDAFGPEGTFNGWNVEKPVNRRIDYIFLSVGDFILKNYAVISDFVDLKYASDHLPVLVKIELINNN